MALSQFETALPRRRRHPVAPMTLRRRLPRCLTSLLLVVSLLCSQLALASYVCPAASAPERMHEMTASAMPCDGMDEAAPVLCRKHATDASQSFEMAKAATPSLPMVVQ